MPHKMTPNPSWYEYANTLIDRLRKRHGIEPSGCQDEPSELDMLFEKFEGPEQKEKFADQSDQPARQIPARELLTVIRLAATLGSSDAERERFQPCALTLIDGIDVEILETVRSLIKDVLPCRWKIVSAELLEGTLYKNAQQRFDRAVTEALDKIEPLLVLKSDGIVLPKTLKIIAPAKLTLAPISSDIVIKFLDSGHLSHEIEDVRKLRFALGPEPIVTTLSTGDVCAALRAPSLHQAIAQMGKLVHRNPRAHGTRLEDISGDSPALRVARRLTNDLLDWKANKVKWDEVSRSLLLYGAPGTGKTFLARAMGNSAELEAVTGSFGVWQAAGHLGDMLREMRATFAEARRKAPCLLIIDEMDAVGSRTDSDRHASHYRVQVITTFLSEMDQIAMQEGVVVVGTCNHIDRMDPAVLRAGRMDLKVEVPLPDAEAILAILRHHLSEDIADHELRTLSRRAVGHSAADIDAAIRAARSDARHARKLLTCELLERELSVGPDSENRDVIWRIAVHEAGHAVVAQALRIGEIERITSTEDGGNIRCRFHPHEARLQDLEAHMAYSMAGRAAERFILGEVSAGAGGTALSDLALATKSAIRIETTYGLGFEGPVWHASPETAHLSTPGIRDRVRQRVTRAEDRATSILRRNEYFLETLARRLAEKRSLNGPEIVRLLDGVIDEISEPPRADLPA